MIEFLHGEHILSTIKQMLEGASTTKETSIDLAVSYWGRGSIEKLDIDGSKHVRILCDLLSGACNPMEMRKFLDDRFSERVQVRHLSGLHSKAYLTTKGIIVGSANASANGLGAEGDIGTVEAAIQTDDGSVVRESRAWFNHQWAVATEENELSEELIARALDAWRRLPPSIATKGRSVLDIYARGTEAFRGRVWLTCYFTDASQEAVKKFHDVKKKYYTTSQLQSFDDDNMPLIDCANDDLKTVRIGDTVLDARDGPYTIIEMVPYDTRNSVVLLKPAKDVQGASLPSAQKKLLKKAIGQHHTEMKNVLKRSLTDEEKNFACNLEHLKVEAPVVHQHLIDNAALE